MSSAHEQPPKPQHRIDAEQLELELPGWARLAGHELVGEHEHATVHTLLIRRGLSARVLAEQLPARGAPPALRDAGELHTADWRGARAEPPPPADPSAGFVPLGSVAEGAAPAYHWALSDRDALWADDVGELVEQASAQQWDASREIPWEAARELDDVTERAVAQVMTFLAQNEYAALYVPAGFLPHVNPQLAELVLWLGGHIHDEARHIEVFTKRSLAGGHRGYALASTELSLQTLLSRPRRRVPPSSSSAIARRMCEPVRPLADPDRGADDHERALARARRAVAGGSGRPHLDGHDAAQPAAAARLRVARPHKEERSATGMAAASGYLFWRSRSSEQELMQYRRPVGWGPSSNTWPR